MDISRIPSIFKNVKREPKRFNYAPRHFDPQAEELEKRKAKIRDEMGMEESGKPGNSIHFQESWRRSRRRSGAASSNIRLLLILAILLFLVFSVVKWLERYQ